MDQFDSIINLVSPAPPGCESAAPLILIHDGGGTAVSYFYLDALDRAVYAIANPRFYSGEEWKGGLAEMGRVYARAILEEVRRGPVLLGGWSLGGLLSVEVASILSQSSSLIQVLGIVMIDSIYPHVNITSSTPPTIVPSESIFGISTKDEMRARVSHCMSLAFAMVKAWVPPVWQGCEDKATYERRVEAEESLTRRMGRQYGVIASKANMDMEKLPPPPQTVLLKCAEYVPVTKSDVPGAVAWVDVVREQEKLGWQDYPYDFISAVLEIPGHHFNIFTEPYLDDVASRIKLACRMLERVNL